MRCVPNSQSLSSSKKYRLRENQNSVRSHLPPPEIKMNKLDIILKKRKKKEKRYCTVILKERNCYKYEELCTSTCGRHHLQFKWFIIDNRIYAIVAKIFVVSKEIS